MGWVENVIERAKKQALFTAPVAVDPMTMPTVTAPTVAPMSFNVGEQQQVTVPAMPTIAAPAVAPMNFPINVNAQPAQPTTTYKPGSLFRGTDKTIGEGYTRTLSDALTGKLYDPMAAGIADAQARTEANQRAKTAGQIAQAGMAGQGIGRQIGAATEGDILQSRYATNIGIEQARAEGRLAALPEARALATEQQKITGEAGVNFAAYVQARPGIESYTVEQVAADPTLMQQGRDLWTSLGMDGEPTAEWVRQQTAYANDPRLTNEIVAANYMIDKAVEAGSISREDGELLKGLGVTYMLKYFTMDPETGRVTFNQAAFDSDYGTSPPEGSDKPEGKTNGDIYLGGNGNLYIVEEGEPVALDVRNVTAEQLKVANDPELTAYVLERYPTSPNAQPQLWASFEADQEKGLIKVNINGVDTFLIPISWSSSGVGDGKRWSIIQYRTLDNKSVQLHHDERTNTVWWKGV